MESHHEPNLGLVTFEVDRNRIVINASERYERERDQGDLHVHFDYPLRRPFRQSLLHAYCTALRASTFDTYVAICPHYNSHTPTNDRYGA